MRSIRDKIQLILIYYIIHNIIATDSYSSTWYSTKFLDIFVEEYNLLHNSSFSKEEIFYKIIYENILANMIQLTSDRTISCFNDKIIIDETADNTWISNVYILLKKNKKNITDYKNYPWKGSFPISYFCEEFMKKFVEAF